MLLRFAVVGLFACVAGCASDVVGLEEEEVQTESAIKGGARHKVIADVDLGGGVIVANRPGGFYMGRLFPGMSFDREGAWYTSKENGTSYAWGKAFGHSNACLWIGPSRGKLGFTAGKWASAGNTKTDAPSSASECDHARKDFLQTNDAANIASHWNCPPPTKSAHGTEKIVKEDTMLFWNVTFGSSDSGYEGGPAKDPARLIKKGTSVWYRYTTNDNKHIVVFVPTIGWGFMPIGAVDRSQTGTWTFPEKPGEPHKC